MLRDVHTHIAWHSLACESFLTRLCGKKTNKQLCSQVLVGSELRYRWIFEHRDVDGSLESQKLSIVLPQSREVSNEPRLDMSSVIVSLLREEGEEEEEEKEEE